MKILAIDSSPRKGNTDFMLKTILGSADAETEVIYLRDKKIDFCGGGSEHCKNNYCCIEDDIHEIYGKLESADIIILASPTYFSNVTARMKNFMDRCNPYYYNKKLKGKKFFLLAVGGYEPSVKEAIKCMKNFLKGIHAESIGSYHAVADKINEIKENQKVIKELKSIGKELINKK